MLLTIENLRTMFRQRNATIKAVRSFSLSLRKGESVGIVGESGSGKTVMTHSLLRLISQPPGIIEGNAYYDGIDLLSCNETQLRSIRGNSICMIFQDPMTSFNPYYRLVDQLVEPLLLHRAISRKDAIAAATEALAATGIADAHQRIKSYPHQFSGGMLQRAMIAMAVMMKPQLIIADEPTTALDVTVQAQLLRLMKRLIVDHGISIMLITHNLGIVNGFCDRIVVMYAGMILETAPAHELFSRPAHPYTRALIRSVPGCKNDVTKLYSISGSPPDPTQEIIGCPFYPRCEERTDICRSATSAPVNITPDHTTACVRYIRGELT